jgi:hypothetical protein
LKNGDLKTRLDLLLGFASGVGQWIIDSGATNHISRSKDLVKDLRTGPSSAGYVTYGDSSRSKVLGLDKVVISQKCFNGWYI